MKGCIQAAFVRVVLASASGWATTSSRGAEANDAVLPGAKWCDVLV